MKNSILKGNAILAVNNELDVLNVLEGKIKEAYPDSFFDKATTYKEATERMASWTYDLVILGGIGVRGFDLLKNAFVRNYPAVMLTDYLLGSEALRQSIELGVRAYLPKEKIGEIVSLLGNRLTYKYLPVWKRFYNKMKGLFGIQSGSNWEKSMNTRAISTYQN